MKKSMFKLCALTLSLLVLLGAFPISVYALDHNSIPIDYNDEEIGYNTSTIKENAGFIWQNQKMVKKNAQSGTIHNNAKDATVEQNYGKIGTSTASSREYGVSGNAGTIENNYGQITNSTTGSFIFYNYGSVTGTNSGYIHNNYESGTIFNNVGTIAENKGQIEYNSLGGLIGGNTGTISEVNTGTVRKNLGTIAQNGVSAFGFPQPGVVEENQGAITLNEEQGTVGKNTGTVGQNKGAVDNYTGGTVTENTAKGVVYNYGGTVQQNSGKHYIQADLKAEHMTVSYGEGFSSYNGADFWLLAGTSGKAVITPEEDYEIKTIATGNGITAAEKNSDGSWRVTVGGLSANATAESLGISPEQLPQSYTITIITGSHGEDISVEVPRGENIFTALDNAGVFDTLNAMETEDYIFRDLATKPLSEFANEEEYGDDAYALLQKTVDSDMTVYAGFYTKLKSVSLSLKAPVAGTVISVDEENRQTPQPVVTLADGSHCMVATDSLYWDAKEGDGSLSWFEGAFEAGKTYCAEMILTPEFGYWMDDNTEVICNGCTVEESGGRMSLYVILSATAVEEPLLGDINGDGYVTIGDVTAIQRHLADLEYIDETLLAAADVNQDGKLDVDDATHLQRFLARFFESSVIGKPME